MKSQWHAMNKLIKLVNLWPELKGMVRINANKIESQIENVKSKNATINKLIKVSEQPQSK